jgi:hypothetical protein
VLQRSQFPKRTKPVAIATWRTGTFEEQGPMQHPQPVAAINGCDPKGVPG